MNYQASNEESKNVATIKIQDNLNLTALVRTRTSWFIKKYIVDLLTWNDWSCGSFF